MKLIELGYNMPLKTISIDQLKSFLTVELEFTGDPWYHEYHARGITAEFLNLEMEDDNFKLDPKKKNDFELQVDCRYDEYDTKEWYLKNFNIYRQCANFNGKVARFVNPLELKPILTNEGYNFFLDFYEDDINKKIEQRLSDIKSCQLQIMRHERSVLAWQELIRP